ncbi:MAG: hemolysin D [Planctomycetia bacterium]|nr:hemolysin D [Planctomycetia bacterium]
MSTIAELPTTASERATTVRARVDLRAVRQLHQGVVGWIIKNPLSLDYYRLLDEEYFLLRQLDGRKTPSEIKRAFESRYAPQTIDFDEIQRYIALLHRDGLVVSAAAGQAEPLARRSEERKLQMRRERYGNPFALRFRGVDPDRLLNGLYPWLGWFFSSWCVLICSAMIGAAGLAIVARFDEFAAALPTFHQFFTPSNIAWLGVSLAVVKVLHELGHGLACKHFGGECHELGFMLLFFTPTMYCNVSDSWLLPNKWQRAAIGAAGMYVELVIAAPAVFLWRFSEPGIVHSLALNVIFICTVSTLLVNANPLMRYDGYYILSDLLEITNLGSKATAALRRGAGRLCLGIRYADADDPLLPRKHVGLFVAYAVASSVYRWFVFFGILWFFNKVFEPYRLDVVGHAFGAIAVGGLILMPIRGVRRFFSVPGRMQLVNKSRAAVTISVLGAIVFAALVVPLPHRAYAPLEVRPRDAHSVYVEVPGTIEAVFVRPGEAIVAGQPLAKLANVDVRIEVDRLVGRRDEARVMLASMQKERFTDPLAASRAALAEQSLAALDQLLAKREADLERLTIRAPTAGTVLPPPETAPQPTDDGRLREWSGTPLDKKNIGSTLPAGTLFCRIGDPNRMEAMLLVDQGDIEFIHLEQPVDVRLNETPGRTWHAQVREISKTDAKIAPRQLSNKSGGEMATRTDDTGTERLRSAAYQVRVFPLDDPHGMLRIALAGEAKIYVGTQTPAQMLARGFRQTFHFEW